MRPFRLARKAYDDLVIRSLGSSKEDFWMDVARSRISWFREPTKALSSSRDDVFSNWFPDGETNMSYNCLDRHLEMRGDQTAIAYESPVGGRSREITYASLLDQVKSFAGSLANMGVEKGDRVIIYMPMVPEAAIAMLACTRIGAVHSVVFGGFASKELASRIDAAQPKALIAADYGLEGLNKIVPYTRNVIDAIEMCDHDVSSLVMFQRPEVVSNQQVEKTTPKHLKLFDFQECVEDTSTICEDAVALNANDPLYTIYTSGTTGDPKGILRDLSHIVPLSYTMEHFYGIAPGEVFAAFSDIGWVVGHSYSVYAPLIHGCTSVMFEGKPVGTPDAATYWRVIEKYGVNSIFTAPTALRAIRKEDPSGKMIEDFDITTLRSVFVAGERCDPSTVTHFESILGKQIPIVDHWWQTESGSPMCGMQLDDVGTVPGSCGAPLPGFDMVVLDENGHEVKENEMGSIALRLPLPPGFMTTLWQNDERFVEAYMSEYPGFYSAADAGYRDENGYLHIMTRTDDILNVAGHRLSSGALEEACLEHEYVVECAVVGCSHELKGMIPVAFVVTSESNSENISSEVVSLVRDRVGAVAALKNVLIVPALPKTRSGKILRNILRAISDGNNYKVPGTIEDASVLDVVHEVVERDPINHY